MKDNNHYYAYLDRLRDSGATNMYEAVPTLMNRFGLGVEEAQSILGSWMAQKSKETVNFVDVGDFLDAFFGKKGKEQ